MEQEPQRILRDEGATGLNALAMLEAVGRGAERPSEIASRLGTAQTNRRTLSRQCPMNSGRLWPASISLAKCFATDECAMNPGVRSITK